MRAENVCRFTGKLLKFETKLVGNDNWLLGKGEILLPDPENENIGQYIKIMAWEKIADKVSKIAPYTWISVIGSYTPSSYNNRLEDVFTIGGVIKYDK